jgi:hypothetical protein
VITEIVGADSRYGIPVDNPGDHEAGEDTAQSAGPEVTRGSGPSFATPSRGNLSCASVMVLVETLRGGPRDAPVNRVLKAVDAAPTAPVTGRDAGKAARVNRRHEHR